MRHRLPPGRLGARVQKGKNCLPEVAHPKKRVPAMLKLALRYARYAVVTLTTVGFALTLN